MTKPWTDPHRDYLVDIALIALVVVVGYVGACAMALALRQPALTSTQRLLCLPEALTWSRCEGAR